MGRRGAVPQCSAHYCARRENELITNTTVFISDALGSRELTKRISQHQRLVTNESDMYMMIAVCKSTKAVYDYAALEKKKEGGGKHR